MELVRRKARSIRNDWPYYATLIVFGCFLVGWSSYFDIYYKTVPREKAFGPADCTTVQPLK